MKSVDKVEKITVEHRVRKYVACDGKEFDSPFDCEAYETALIVDTINKKVKYNPALSNTRPLDSDCSEFSDYYWYMPQSEDDIKLLNDTFGVALESMHIGDWVCIECTEDLGFYHVGSLKSTIRDVECYIKAFGYDVDIALTPNSDMP